MKVEWSL